jgi:hypothetical protein
MCAALQSVSPSLRIKFIQAAKEGQLDVLKKFVEGGVSIDTVVPFMFLMSLSLS